MKKILFNKSLAIGIIVLFICAGIHPAFAVNTKQSIVNKKSKEDCGCNEVSESDLIKVEKLLDRVEVYSKLLLVLSKDNPEVLEDYEEISNIISKLKTLDLKEQICDWLLNIFNKTVDLSIYYGGLSSDYEYDGRPVLALTFLLINYYYILIGEIFICIYLGLGCYIPPT